MYNFWIIDYIERTTPVTALEANTESGKKMIREELKTAIAKLLSAKESFALIGMQEESKIAFDKAVFAGKWLYEFGMN